MTDYTPAQWAAIFSTAYRRLRANPKDARALEAYRAAQPHIAAMRESERDRQFLKDVDPGALASFGLGMADMMSFGLGDQIARKLDEEVVAAGKPELSHQAALTQRAAKERHGAAHVAGEVAGFLTPAAAEVALTKAGVMVPMALAKFIQAIKNPYLRWGGKTALSATEGALYAGAQAGGRTEGDLGERLEAAGEAAPFGAAVGAVLPSAIPATQVAIDRAIVRPARYFKNIVRDVADRAAGKPVTPRGLPNIKMDLTPEGVGSLTSVRRPAGDPLDIPTFWRRKKEAEQAAELLRSVGSDPWSWLYTQRGRAP